MFMKFPMAYMEDSRASKGYDWLIWVVRLLLDLI